MSLKLFFTENAVFEIAAMAKNKITIQDIAGVFMKSTGVKINKRSKNAISKLILLAAKESSARGSLKAENNANADEWNMQTVVESKIPVIDIDDLNGRTPDYIFLTIKKIYEENPQKKYFDRFDLAFFFVEREFYGRETKKEFDLYSQVLSAMKSIFEQRCNKLIEYGFMKFEPHEGYYWTFQHKFDIETIVREDILKCILGEKTNERIVRHLKEEMLRSGLKTQFWVGEPSHA